MKKNKIVGGIIIALVYIITLACGIGLFYLLPENMKKEPLFPLFLIDIVCTIIVYLFSTIFKNSSIYDPYWSVAPPLIYAGFILMTGYSNIYVTIFMILVIIWSVRLTTNWWMNFKNLSIQDWRYQNFKEKHPKTFFLINLFGIHLFPTVIVFMGMLPGFYFMEKAVTIPLNFGVIFGFVMMLFATIIELVADLQMFAFRKKEENRVLVMNKGLWKISRHPNYFGEILFWISIWLCYFSVVDLGDVVKMILSAASPICIFIMFVFVSIPMLEKRQLKRRPGYKEYMDNTNMLLIYPLLKTKK